MPQHDFTIAGGTSPGSPSRTEVRQDIEAALQALASTSKGSSEPATVYPGQLWVDDDVDTNVWALKIRAGSSSREILRVNTSTGDVTFTGVSSGVPAGVITDYAGSSAPSGWLLCYGQAISRSTYADLFTAIGTTFGIGDGSTTFNLPDYRGRVAAGKDNMGGSSADRLTNQSGGLNGDTLGAVGGLETHTLTSAQQASMTVTGSGTGPVFDNSGTPGGAANPIRGTDNFGGSFPVTFSGTASGGGGAHNNVQPTIILNKIIKT